MQNKNIENHIEFLMDLALKKCGNIHDAEDLTQETLLAALSYISQGKVIDDMRAWLTVVINRKFNDKLRRKYQQPMVSIGDGFDIIDDNALCFSEENDDAERIRKAVAHLAKIYREVIVRYYMNNQSVSQIADELSIPEGTVKSRLHIGRNNVKKGIVNMEKYSKQSYSPIALSLSYSGGSGLNNEPLSLVKKEELIKQNILWLAYPKPITIEEISLSIGIPTAYTEPIIKKLVDNELMKKVGNKFYTDFIIYTFEDKEKYISDQKQLVEDNFDLFWQRIESGLKVIKNKDFYKRCSFDAKNSLELYFVINCLDYGIYDTFIKNFNQDQIFPNRPNGGKWVTFGNLHLNDFNYKEHLELLSHSYSGERKVWFEKTYADTKSLGMFVYDLDGFPCYNYHNQNEYEFISENTLIDSELTKLLYIIYNHIPPEQVGFNSEFFKAIPWLTKCKILREENKKPVVNVPILNKSELEELLSVTKTTRSLMSNDIKDIFAEFLKDKKQEIPPHLDSVPLLKQYLYSFFAIPFAVIRQAIKNGGLYDGNYDDDSNGINQPPCPMILIIDK